MKFLFLLIIGCLIFSTRGFAQTNTSPNEGIWSYTYLKANKDQKSQLKKVIQRNWFAMDSIAMNQRLIRKYELIENSDDNGDWDFIVAVQYYTKGGYDDIAEQFELIRKSHIPVKVDGLTLIDVGKVVRSEMIDRKN